MDRYVNCIAHSSSEGNLLIGESYAALFDCGMMFCAGETIRRVKEALGDRPLDYIFATHTHYDHIGALPFFRAQWPGLRLVTCEAGAAVLLKDTPRRVIRALSITAAKLQGVPCDFTYSDDAFQADVIVKEHDAISLGGVTVEVLETPGHTRDSLSYFVPELGILILNETLGFHMPDGSVHPCYLTSYDNTLRSIEKCRRVRHTFLSLPHRGIISGEEAHGYFDKALTTATGCRDFIIGMRGNGLDEDEMLALFSRKYSTGTLLDYQPKEAFFANAKATIACTLRESAANPLPN